METRYDLSIIICSIDPSKAAATVANIEATSGLTCEAVVVDNRTRQWPIAKAYNYGASIAKAPYLFFAHEDILFENSGWGPVILERLSEKETGVIGFIGSQVRLHSYGGWGAAGDRYYVGHHYYYLDGRKCLSDFGEHGKGDFREAVVVDGLGMLVSRDKWALYPFDEDVLKGFHCYDIDFCLEMARHYTNYVYMRAEICHYSNGTMDEQWGEATVEITDRKWRAIPQMAVGESRGVDLEKLRRQADYSFVYTVIRDTERFSKAFAKRMLKKYIRQQLSEKKPGRIGTLLYQYLHKRI